jgi:hypothetical protein
MGERSGIVFIGSKTPSIDLNNLRSIGMIRKILPKHRASLETLYAESVYLKLPKIVKWTLGAARERVFVVEEQNEVRAAMYTDVYGARAKDTLSQYLFLESKPTEKAFST